MPGLKGNTNILLVNGEVTLQHLRALMLRMKGYDVESASTLDEAKQKLASGSFKLVIVDVGYYAEPGLRFCEEVKQTHPKVKVVMQANRQLFLNADSCPDKVISKQEGPQTFLSEVEMLLQTSQEPA